MNARVAALTFFTLVAFASNSVLTRLALKEGQIDAGSFTLIRIASGALFLWLVITLPKRFGAAREDARPPVDARPPAGDWKSGLALFGYAACFSVAYLDLPAGTGALLLFGMVQATMIVYGIVRGERPTAIEWAGLVLALAGLVYLVSPGLSAPSPFGAAMMAVAGLSWGFYSVFGRGVPDPAAATAGNFARALPFALVFLLVYVSRLSLQPAGVLLAVVSGAVTSGLGYVLWYRTLVHLTVTRAAVVQLAVPVLVAIAGVLFLAEKIDLRLALSSVVTLGGVGLAVFGKSRRAVR